MHKIPISDHSAVPVQGVEHWATATPRERELVHASFLVGLPQGLSRPIEFGLQRSPSMHDTRHSQGSMRPNCFNGSGTYPRVSLAHNSPIVEMLLPAVAEIVEIVRTVQEASWSTRWVSGADSGGARRRYYCGGWSRSSACWSGKARPLKVLMVMPRAACHWGVVYSYTSSVSS